MLSSRDLAIKFGGEMPKPNTADQRHLALQTLLGPICRHGHRPGGHSTSTLLVSTGPAQKISSIHRALVNSRSNSLESKQYSIRRVIIGPKAFPPRHFFNCRWIDVSPGLHAIWYLPTATLRYWAGRLRGPTFTQRGASLSSSTPAGFRSSESKQSPALATATNRPMG